MDHRQRDPGELCRLWQPQSRPDAWFQSRRTQLFHSTEFRSIRRWGWRIRWFHVARYSEQQFLSSAFSQRAELVSSPDLTLQDGRVYHITVGLASQSGSGQINFTTNNAEGGTYTSTFTVTPIFTLTNVNNSTEPAHVINCATDPTVTCSFPINGSGSWVLTSTTGFDPQSQGIPIVPSGVHVGGYTTVGQGAPAECRLAAVEPSRRVMAAARITNCTDKALWGRRSTGPNHQMIALKLPPPPPPPAPSPTPVPDPPTEEDATP